MCVCVDRSSPSRPREHLYCMCMLLCQLNIPVYVCYTILWAACTSSPTHFKGQSTKTGTTGASKTHSIKTKSITSGGNPSSLIEPTPTSRSSQRAVKRPRNYDDDSVDYEPPKSGGKKMKGNPKGTKSAAKKGIQSSKVLLLLW